MVLEAAIRVPDAAGDLSLRADLRARKVITSVAIDAPGEGRPATRVNWLLKQLKDAPASLIVEASFVNTKATTAWRLDELRDNAQRLLLESDPKRPPRGFTLTLANSNGSQARQG